MSDLTPAQSNFKKVMTLIDGIEDGDWDIARVVSEFSTMLSHGWDVNFKYNPQPGSLQTLSTLSLCLPYPALVSFLLEHSYDPNEQFSNYSTPLTLAISAGWTAQVHTLLSHSASPAISCPLHIAASLNRADLITLLLDHGAPIDAVVQEELPRGASRRANPYRRAALHEAAKKGKVECVRLLLERGADPTVRDSSGEEPWEKVGEMGGECRDLLRRAAEEWKGRDGGRNGNGDGDGE